MNNFLIPYTHSKYYLAAEEFSTIDKHLKQIFCQRTNSIVKAT